MKTLFPRCLRSHRLLAAARRVLQHPAGLLLLVFGWFAASAWMRPLSLPDEGRYVGVAWEMLRSGDWLVPTLDTLPYFHKPPLFYWLTAASLAAFGRNEWAARLPALLAATGAAAALYLFCRRWLGEERARNVVLILATTPFFFACAQFANLDMLVAAAIGATILTAADALLSAAEHRPQRRLGLVAAYVFAALGVLAKGLIGVVIPALVIVLWVAYLGRPSLLLRLVSLPGVVLFALIVTPWFALVEAQHHDFLRYFFIHHHFERYTTQDFNSQRPLWFYVPVLAGFTLPWFVFLPRATKGFATDTPAPRGLNALMWIWVLATLAFFSIPRSKLLGYILVAVPPLAVLFQHGIEQFAGGGAAVRRWTLRLGALAALICGTALAGALFYERDNVRGLIVKVRPLMAADDEIVALHTYPFSLGFYLGAQQPIRVVENWDELGLLRKDGWRRELSEAAAFADPPRARTLLLRPGELGAFLACARHSVWVIGSERLAAQLDPIAGLERVARAGSSAIWHSAPVHTPAASCGP